MNITDELSRKIRQVMEHALPEMVAEQPHPFLGESL